MVEVLARIVAPHFVAGIVIVGGRVTEAAPIIRYMIGWDPHRVLAYVKGKGWEVRSLPVGTR